MLEAILSFSRREVEAARALARPCLRLRLILMSRIESRDTVAPAVDKLGPTPETAPIAAKMKCCVWLIDLAPQISAHYVIPVHA